MDDLQLENKILLSKYNNKKDVVRCPRGRAKFKGQLDDFTYVSSVLYGVIKLEDLTRIYNEVYDGDLKVNEVKAMLLPFILDGGAYYFYEDYVIEESFADNLDQLGSFYQEQTGKEFYIPSKDEYDNFNNLNDEKLFELRSLLWEDRNVINEYIKTDDTLKDYAIDILKEWHEKAIEGNFIVIDHKHNGAVISVVDNRNDDTINFYEVKGMSNSIAKVLKNKSIFVLILYYFHL